MKSLRYALALTALCSAYSVHGGEKDSTDVAHSIREHLSPAVRFMEAAYANPAARPYAYRSPLTTLSLSGRFSTEDEATLMQQGEGSRYGTFDANSYLHLRERNTVWGDAGYRFGHVRHVLWNETADFELLFPYVMADSVGGDLSCERYTFGGGFARIQGRFSWGIQAGYRAQIEYRKVDPRPRNVVSDLNLSAGGTFALNGRYSIGASFYGQAYQQKNNIAFYAPQGRPKVYQMTGLGMYSTRFSDGNTDLMHKGGGYGAGMEFFPRDKRGFSAAVRYNDFSVKRIMTSHNNLPLTRLQEQTLSGTAAWQRYSGRSVWGAKISACHKKRTGTEFIYGDGSGASNYPKIGEVQQYRNERTELGASLLWGYESPRQWALYVEPRGGLFSMDASYLSPSRQMRFDKPWAGIDITGTANAGRSCFRLGGSLDYRGVASQRMLLTGLNMESSIGQMMQQLFDRLTSEATLYGISAQWVCRTAGSAAFILQGTWRRADYRDGNSSQVFEIGCGIGF